jgi:hypothetical protein
VIQSYVRSAPISKIKDPKPILSQTGSPMMPGQTPSFNTPHTIKRYRPTSTLPRTSHLAPRQHLTTNIFSSSSSPSTNLTAQPYNDKNMVNQLQQSLFRAAHSNRGGVNHVGYHYPVIYPSSSSSGPSGSVLSNTITYYDDPHLGAPSFGAGGIPSANYSDFNSASSASQGPVVKNVQYNSPIGLYSRDNIRQELNRQVG